MEIGTGPSGSETTKIQLPFRWDNTMVYGHAETIMLPIPFEIPSSTRVAARFACDPADRDVHVKILYTDK